MPANMLNPDANLEPLRKPLMSRYVAFICTICVVLVGLNASSLVASYRAAIEDSGVSTANMARALASHAERSIKIGDAVLGEMVERVEFGQRDNTALERLHAPARYRTGHAGIAGAVRVRRR